MKEIKTYSDNLEGEVFENLLLLLNKSKQTLEYFDSCAKRMGRYAKKNKPLKFWPAHIRNKYYYVTGLHNKAQERLVYTT